MRAVLLGWIGAIASALDALKFDALDLDGDGCLSRAELAAHELRDASPRPTRWLSWPKSRVHLGADAAFVARFPRPALLSLFSKTTSPSNPESKPLYRKLVAWA